MMSWGEIFKVANTVALISWACLALLPRFPKLLLFLRYGIITGFAVVYTLLVAAFFFRVEGGGFNSLEQVKALFSSDAALVAGWIHYLAFDLFVGLWIAETSDRKGIYRLVQIPLLLVTFLFGPIGLLLFYFVLLGTHRLEARTSTPSA